MPLNYDYMNPQKLAGVANSYTGSGVEQPMEQTPNALSNPTGNGGGSGMPAGSLGAQSGYKIRPGTTYVSPNGMYARDANGQTYFTGNSAYEQKSDTGGFTTTGDGFSYSGPLDMSYRDIAKGDQFTGKRGGFLWVAGNRIMPTNGDDAVDMGELVKQFGVGGASANTNPLLRGMQTAAPGTWQGQAGSLATPATNTGGRWMGDTGNLANPTGMDTGPTRPTGDMGGGSANIMGADKDGWGYNQASRTNPVTGEVEYRPGWDSGLVAAANQNPLARGGANATNTMAKGGADAAGQPARQNRVSVDSTTGHLALDGQSVRPDQLYGRIGRHVTNMDENQMVDRNAPMDPAVWQWGTINGRSDESGHPQQGWVMRPDVAQRLNGRIQLGQAGVGGWGEVVDPSQVEYDEEFGFLTAPQNIKTPGDNGLNGWLNDNAAYVVAAGLGAAAYGASAAGAGSGTTAGVVGEAEQALASQVAGQGGVTGATEAGVGTVAGETLATPPPTTPTTPPVTPPTTPPPVVPPGGSSLVTPGNIVRGVSTAANVLRGSGGSGGSGSSPTGGGGNPLADVVTGGVNNYQNNQNIQRFQDTVSSMIERGDPYGPERAAAIARLRALEANPGSVDSNPLFAAQNDKSQTDLQRRMAARGMNVSGNELGALQENYLANMNKFYGEEWTRLAQEAGVNFNPSTMAGQGIRAAGDMYQARTDRDAGLNAFLRRQSNGAGGSLWDSLQRYFSDNGDGTTGMTDEDWNSFWDEFVAGGGNVGDSDSNGTLADFFDEYGWGMM